MRFLFIYMGYLCCVKIISVIIRVMFRNNPWEVYKVIDRSVRVFTAILGPSGGENGYYKITGNLLFYILRREYRLILLYVPVFNNS